MKKKQLTAKLMKIGLILVAILIMLGGVYMFLTLHKDDLNAGLRVLQNDTTSKLAELKRLQREVTSSREAEEFYGVFKNTDDAKSSSFRKDYLRDVLGQIKEDVSVNKLLFTIEPFVEMEGSEQRRKNAVMVTSNVKIQFAAIDDLHAQRLLDEIERRLPGNVYYTKFSIEKLRNISDRVLLDISKGRVPDLVRGELEFRWSGIKEIGSGARDAGSI